MLDRDLIKELSTISEIYEDVTFSQDCKADILCIGSNGVYAVVDEKADVEIFNTIKKELKLKNNQLLLFVYEDNDNNSFYDYKLNKFVKQLNLYDAYANCYVNHNIPNPVFDKPSDYCQFADYEFDEDVYVTPVITDNEISSIEKQIDDILNRPVYYKNYRIFPKTGEMQIKRTVTKSVAGLSTFVETGTAYYPCMSMSGDKFFLITFLAGMFGVHKFKTSNYLTGLCYLLTCGCCGVFYVLDLVMILAGGYNYNMISCDRTNGVMNFQKKKFYSRPVENKKIAVILTLLSILIAFLVVTDVYMPLLQHINKFLSDILSDTQLARNLAENIQK